MNLNAVRNNNYYSNFTANMRLSCTDIISNKQTISLFSYCLPERVVFILE